MSKEWETLSLSHLVDRVVTRNSQGLDRVFSVSAQHGLVDQETYFNKRVASKDLSRYWVVEPADYVFNKSYSEGFPLGVVARNETSAPGVVSPLYIVMRCKSDKVADGWLDLAFLSQEYATSLQGLMKEGGRAHGALNVKLGDYFTAVLPVPPLQVQRRIVDLMAHLNGHLANLRAEREAAERLLATSRQVLMGHLPAVPLTTVLKDARAGGTPDRKQPDFYGGDIPWLKSGEVQADFIRTTEERITPSALASSSAWLLPPGTPVLAMYGATAGASGYAAVEMSTNQAVLALVPHPDRAHSRFLFHWLRLNGPALKQAASGAAQPNLSKQVVLRELGFPSMDVSEQRAVAQTLDSISALTGALGNEIQHLIELRSRVLAGLLAGDCPISVDYDALLPEVA